MDAQTFFLIAPPILLALVLHEFSHAWVANLLGDDTAKLSGRLTLNPLAHLDLMGTIMIFLVHFGWAKPVPVNPHNLRNPKQDMLWVSLAGPASNMVLAFISGMLLRLVTIPGAQNASGPVTKLIVIMLVYSLQINLALAIFNILPIAPLDGSKILYGILPQRYAGFVALVERYGPIILMAIIALSFFAKISILGWIIWPFVRFFSTLFSGITV